MNKAARTLGPPPMRLLPFHPPDCRAQGASEAKRRDPLAVELPNLRQFGNQGSRDHWSDARHCGEQVYSPRRCSPPPPNPSAAGKSEGLRRLRATLRPRLFPMN
jgi:hypothetical protein